MENEKATTNGKIVRFTKWSGARKVKCTCGCKIKVGEEYEVLYISPGKDHPNGETVGPLHTYCLDLWLWRTNLERQDTPEAEAELDEPDRIAYRDEE